MQILGYTAHGAIDATIDGIRMVVPDDAGNRHRQLIAAWEAKGNTIPPYVPPPPSPAPYRLYRSALVRRLTNAEAASLEVLLNSEEPYLRLLYNSSDYFMSDDALFAYLATVLEEALGETRASQLLAPGG